MLIKLLRLIGIHTYKLYTYPKDDMFIVFGTKKGIKNLEKYILHRKNYE